MPRNQKTSSYNDNIVREAEAIAKRISEYDLDFTSGVRGILLLHRKKDGFDGAYPQRDCRKRVVDSYDDYVNCLCEYLDIMHKSEHELRIYASCNPRDMAKAVRTFKQNQLDNDYADEDTHRGFYRDIHNRFFSALMTPTSKADNKFIIDVDDVSVMDAVDKLCAELDLTVYTKYATKNGWHLVVAPFNPSLWSLEGTNIKKDPLILIKY